MTISIVKSESKVSALVAAISTKSGAYKETVSSALLSTVQHAIDTGDYTLITKLIAEVQAANPRDLKVVGSFLKDMTPFKVDAVAEGRINTFIVSGRLAKDFALDESKTFKSQKDKDAAIKSAKDKAEKRDAVRLETFNRFIGSLTNEKGEVMPRGAVVPDETSSTGKTVFDYQLNIFTWFDDVTYFRTKGENGKGGKAEFDFDVTFVSKVSGLIKACKDQTLTAEQQSALDAVTAFYNAASQRKADKEESEKAGKETAAAVEKEAKQLAEVNATEAETAQWVAHRAKRVAEGKTNENIAIEFKAHIKAMKANKEKAEIEAAQDESATA